jgi:hypothetical protein
MNPHPLSRTPLRPFSAHWLLAGAIASLLPVTASADAVTDWNAIANGVIAGAGAPPQQYRVFAMTHVAIHDALNAIQPRYRSYNPIGAANPNASKEAAIAAAARTVLVETLPPAQDAIVEGLYATYLAGLSCPAAYPACINAGVTVGTAAGQAIIDRRVGDGSEMPHLPYTLAPAPGVYQPTLPLPPAPAPYPQFGNWGNLTPFALSSSWQFAPGRSALQTLTSPTYTRDFNEVKALGSALVRGAAPDSEESRIAMHWGVLGGANVNGYTRTIVAGRNLSLWQNARLFALVNIAVNDGLIVVFKAKFRYNFWRPYTAIRAAASDGNPATAADPDWNAYVTTPPYPDYPCGLPSTIASSTQVLRSFFGTDNVPFSFGTPARQYDTLSQAAAESAMARVYGGMHFRSGCLASLHLGQNVGRYVYSTQLRPL